MSRSSTSLVLVAVALLTAPLAGAANGAPTTSGSSKQAIRALTIRGQALNQTYHLGALRRPVEASDPRDDPPRPGAQPDLPPRRSTPARRSKRSARSPSAARRSTRPTTSAQYAGGTGSSFPWLAVAFAAAAGSA